MPTAWALLLKFGDRKHLEAFRARGEMFMQPLDAYARLEGKDPLRGDGFEGTREIWQPRDVKEFRFESRDGRVVSIDKERIRGAVRIGGGYVAGLNVFCMHAVRARRPRAPLVDARNAAFGSSFIVVLDTAAFLRRVEAVVRRAGHHALFAFVEYFDPRWHSGETGPFRKPLRFSFQREFRIVVAPGHGESVVLRLGSLARITSKVIAMRSLRSLRVGPKGRAQPIRSRRAGAPLVLAARGIKMRIIGPRVAPEKPPLRGPARNLASTAR